MTGFLMVSYEYAKPEAYASKCVPKPEFGNEVESQAHMSKCVPKPEFGNEVKLLP
jgi:hypothetical protein